MQFHASLRNLQPPLCCLRELAEIAFFSFKIFLSTKFSSSPGWHSHANCAKTDVWVASRARLALCTKDLFWLERLGAQRPREICHRLTQPKGEKWMARAISWVLWALQLCSKAGLEIHEQLTVATSNSYPSVKMRIWSIIAEKNQHPKTPAVSEKPVKSHQSPRIIPLRHMLQQKADLPIDRSWEHKTRWIQSTSLQPERVSRKCGCSERYATHQLMCLGNSGIASVAPRRKPRKLQAHQDKIQIPTVNRPTGRVAEKPAPRNPSSLRLDGSKWLNTVHVRVVSITAFQTAESQS